MSRPVQRYEPRTATRPREPLRDETPSAPAPRTPEAEVLNLQALVGNAAVSRLLARSPDPATKTPEPAEKPITAPGITGMQQYNERASAHYKAGRYERALNDWAEAYRLHPISTFLRDQADALEHLGRNAEAADLYERYLAEGPLMADIPKIRSRIKKLRGEQIPVGEDDDEPPITAKGKAGAQAWFDRGQEAFLAKRFAKAADCFRSAFALDPLPAFIFNEASSLEQGRHMAAAANAYEHYLILNPSAKDAADVLAKVKTLRSQAPAAGKDSLIDPEDEPSEAPAVTAKGKKGASEWHNRGQVAWQLGDYKRAYDCFVEAYALNPAPEFVYNQAASLDKHGNADGAVQAYERYLVLAPKATDAAKVRTRIQLLQARPAGGAPLKAP
jgi:tetratricopeptide (TPR) repeat protein